MDLPERAEPGSPGTAASPDALDPESALAVLAALPLEQRPQALLRLADELERRIEATVAAPTPGRLEQARRES